MDDKTIRTITIVASVLTISNIAVGWWDMYSRKKEKEQLAGLKRNYR